MSFLSSAAVLQFYFESFDYPSNTMYQEDFFAFLAKIGGYMGFAIGGSIISFVEIIAFLAYLVQIIVKDLMQFTPRMITPQ